MADDDAPPEAPQHQQQQQQQQRRLTHVSPVEVPVWEGGAGLTGVHQSSSDGENITMKDGVQVPDPTSLNNATTTRSKEEEEQQPPAAATTTTRTTNDDDKNAHPYDPELNVFSPIPAMRSLTASEQRIVVDLESMKDAVFFLFPDKHHRLSRFWILLLLAAIIATSGVVGDSAATVIGAMIVAPLMTPILGTMLSIVLLDKNNFLYSVAMVLTGVGSCVLIGYVYGLFTNDDLIRKENNSQVAGRVQPKLPDLIGAIATGAVGSIALVRKDIAGALPGVAISISLVPPLCVAGLMGSIDELDDMAGAMLLFATNFMSIQVTGIMIMYFYQVHKMALRQSARLLRSAVIVLLVCFALVAVPLAFTSKRISLEIDAERCVRDASNQVLQPFGWESNLVKAASTGSTMMVTVVASGPPPSPTNFHTKGEPDSEAYVVLEACPDVDVVEFSYFPRNTVEAKDKTDTEKSDNEEEL